MLQLKKFRLLAFLLTLGILESSIVHAQSREYLYLNGKLISVDTALMSVANDPFTVSPSNGGGTSQSFVFRYTHPSAPATQFAVLNGLIRAWPLWGGEACYFALVNNSNPKMLYLVDDGGSNLLSATPLIGQANGQFTGSAANSQCQLNGVGSSVSISGQVLTLTLSVTFPSPSAFAGPINSNKLIWLAATDGISYSSGWLSRGTWEVPPATRNAPFIVASSPSSGSVGTVAASVSLQNPSPDGGWLTGWILINSALDANGACYVAYSAPANCLYLVLNDGTITPGDVGMVPGSGETRENASCTLRANGSSASKTATALTFVAALDFKPAFSGWKIVYEAAVYQQANATVSNSTSLVSELGQNLDDRH
ncbi:MAG: hypothetical protein NTV52_21630 [Acidobacteria bacterium]|nr:hypothetical protein [Acidobacteriota bacterium]